MPLLAAETIRGVLLGPLGARGTAGSAGPLLARGTGTCPLVVLLDLVVDGDVEDVVCLVRA